MANAKINNILIPNVTTLPSQKNVEKNKLIPGETSEFKNLLDSTLDQSGEQESAIPTQSKGIHLSTHAVRRLQERNMSLDKEEYQT